VYWLNVTVLGYKQSAFTQIIFIADCVLMAKGIRSSETVIDRYIKYTPCPEKSHFT